MIITIRACVYDEMAVISSDRGSVDRGSVDRGSVDCGSVDRGSVDRGLNLPKKKG